MILGSISASGVGDPVKIDLIINPERYQQIGIHHVRDHLDGEQKKRESNI